MRSISIAAVLGLIASPALAQSPPPWASLPPVAGPSGRSAATQQGYAPSPYAPPPAPPYAHPPVMYAPPPSTPYVPPPMVYAPPPPFAFPPGRRRSSLVLVAPISPLLAVHTRAVSCIVRPRTWCGIRSALAGDRRC